MAMNGWMMVGCALIALLVLTVLVLGAAALVKYLRSDGSGTHRAQTRG